MSSELHHHTTVSDQPFDRVTYETRSIEQQSREVGALIFKSIRGQGRLREMDAMALALFQAMCYEFGEVEDFGSGGASFVVRTELQDISVMLGWSARSAYRPCRRLESLGLVIAFGPRGKAQNYLLPAVETAQAARASCDQSQLRESNQGAKCAPNQELARASCDQSQLRDSTDSAKTAFLERPPETAQAARASCDQSPSTSTSTPTLTFTSTREAAEKGSTADGGTGGQKTAMEGGGIGWFHPWLIALPALPTDDDARRRYFLKWARNAAINPLLDAELAIAIRIELETSDAASMPNFNPRGMVIHIFKTLPSSVSDASRESAKQQLGYCPPRPPAFAASRIDRLLPSMVGSAVGRNEAEEARELQQTMPKSQLHVIWQEAIRSAPNPFVRDALCKSEPRTSAAVYLLIVEKLKAAQAV